MIATSEPHVSRPWKVKMDLKMRGIYPLVNVYITIENQHFEWVNQLFRLGHGFKFANCHSHYRAG